MNPKEKFPLPVIEKVVKGFHGTKKEYAANSVFTHQFHKSHESDDWLGHGMYFWEDDPGRAIEWATFKYGEEAAVVEVSINLGRCLDLTVLSYTDYVRIAYEKYTEKMRNEGKDITNYEIDSHVLDCSVLNYLTSELFCVDTIRAPFDIGEPIYPGSYLHKGSHIQLVVLNESNLIGQVSLYFEA